MDKPMEAIPERAFTKLAVFSGGAVIVLGAAGLAGWVTGSRTLASLRPEYVPMAPDTGFLFLALGVILLSGAYKRIRGLGRSLAVVTANLALFYGALKTAETLLGVDLTFQRVLFPDTGRLGAIVLERMSPVTGLLFFLSGLALLACLLGRARRLSREAAGGLSAGVLVAGGVATTGYLFGTPLLYGGATVPLAATTAGAFLFLGLGLMAAAGKDSFLARGLSGPSASARLLRGILPVIVLAILLEGLLDTRLGDVSGVNTALLSAVLTLTSMAVTVVIVVRIARSVFRRAEEAEAERRAAEEQLLIKEAALASSMSAIGLASMDGILIYANKAYIDLWGGGQSEDLLGKPLTAFSGYEGPVREVIEALMAGKGYVGENVARLKDGKDHTVQLSANVVTSSDGKPVCMMASFLDITERRRAEEDLRQSEKRYRLLAENMKDVVWTLDPETMRFTYISPSIEALLGYTPEEVMARSVYEGRAPEVAAAVAAQMPEGIARFLADPAADHSYRNEVPQPRKDGSIVWTDVVTRFYRDEETGKILVHGVTRDMSERARAEAALRRSEERFKQIAENEGEFIWEVDATGLYTYASPVIEKILGFRPDELVGKVHYYDLFAPDVREELTAGAMAAFACKESFREFVNPNLRKDGARVILATSGSPILDEAGNLLGYRGADQDITERVRAEEALRDSVKQKEILMKELQHRVKNSLAMVSGLLGLGMEAMDDEAARMILSETRARIRSVASLYEQLYGSDDPDSVNLCRYIQRLTELFSKTYIVGSERIVFKAGIEEFKLDTKRAVPLGLILNELITNSLKYAYPGHGPGLIHIDLDRSGDSVALGVSDDGPGLPEGFDPNSSGGLGWSLIRMLTEEIGGELSFPSGAPGTRVVVRFKP
jgi:PAS domain S-box-containing protein